LFAAGKKSLTHPIRSNSKSPLLQNHLKELEERMSAAFDFSALSPPFLRNLVDAHIFPANPEWTDSSLNRAEQIYAKTLAQVRDTLKDSDKQSSHVMIGTTYPLLLSLALTQSNR
jgi:hypothetical protein